MEPSLQAVANLPSVGLRVTAWTASSCTISVCSNHNRSASHLTLPGLCTQWRYYALQKAFDELSRFSEPQIHPAKVALTLSRHV